MADELKNGAPLPQIVIIGDFNIMRSLPPQYIDQLIKSADGCYEIIKRTSVEARALHDYIYRYVLRILPYKRCVSRMV